MSKFTKAMVAVLIAVVSVNTGVLNWQMLRVENNLKLEDCRVESIEVGLVSFARYMTSAPVMIESIKPAVVKIEIFTGIVNPITGKPLVSCGTGVVVDNGLVLTCKHIISGLNNPRAFGTVTFSDGITVAVLSHASDPNSEISVIKIDTDTTTIATIADANTVRTGDPVWVVGHPFGLDWSVSCGVISRMFPNDPNEQNIGNIQTDASINPGNSGGPVLDRLGRVIGIAIGILSPGNFNIGIGFVIGSDKINKVLPGLIEQLR